MHRPRFVVAAALPSVSLFLVLLGPLGACGGEEPPPRSAAALSAPRGHAVATGGSTTSLSDSALAPAAEEAEKSGDAARAETLYRELARRQPRNAAAKRGLGAALTQQGKHEAAVQALQASLDLEDGYQTRLDLASAFAGMGRYPSALPHLRKAVVLAPKEPAGWAHLADALLKVEKPEGAAEVLGDSRKRCTACAKDDDWQKAADETAHAFAAKADKQLGAGDKASWRAPRATPGPPRPSTRRRWRKCPTPPSSPAPRRASSWRPCCCPTASTRRRRSWRARS